MAIQANEHYKQYRAKRVYAAGLLFCIGLLLLPFTLFPLAVFFIYKALTRNIRPAFFTIMVAIAALAIVQHSIALLGIWYYVLVASSLLILLTQYKNLSKRYPKALEEFFVNRTYN